MHPSRKPPRKSLRKLGIKSKRKATSSEVDRIDITLRLYSHISDTELKNSDFKFNVHSLLSECRPCATQRSFIWPKNMYHEFIIFLIFSWELQIQ